MADTHTMNDTDSQQHAWETKKENAAPLERGRSIHSLQATASDIAIRTRQFEELLQSHHDKLLVYIKYIKYLQDHSVSCVSLLERCFREFYQDDTYKNNESFVKICCLWADKTKEPLTSFGDLYRLGIGRQSSMFWNAWAFLAEKSLDYKLAEQIFEKGISEQAQPMPFLIKRQQRFQRRMSRHFLNSVVDDTMDEEGDEASSEQLQRGILGRLGDGDRQRSIFDDPNPTFADRSQQQSRRTANEPENNAPSFPIFTEESEPEHDTFLKRFAGQRTEREPEKDRHKENTKTTEQWNERNSTQFSAPSVTKAASFSIHVDDDCAAALQRELEQQLRNLEAQRRGRDVRQSSVLSKYMSSKSSGKAKESTKNKENSSSTLVWNPELLQDSGVEQNFEEARAKAQYYTLHTLQENSDMSMDTENTSILEVITPRHATSMVNTSAVLPTPSSRRKRSVPRPPRHNTPRNASTASSTVEENLNVPVEPTINTQLALKELSMMFSSPAVEESTTNFPIIDEKETSTFPIFEDSSESRRPSSPKQPPFQLFQDASPIASESKTKLPGEGAAAFSVYQDEDTEMLDASKHEPSVPHTVYQDDDQKQSPTPKNKHGSSAIFRDNSSPRATKDSHSTDTDTIDSDEIQNLFADMEKPSDSSGRSSTGSGGGTTRLMVELFRNPSTATSPETNNKNLESPQEFGFDLPGFGDISHIENDDTLPIQLSVDKAIDYKSLHVRDIQDSQGRLKAMGMGSLPREKSLVSILARRGTVYDIPTDVLPRPLKKHVDSMQGVELRLGFSKSKIATVLGRGSYGVVVLLTDSNIATVTVKAQTPVGSLAWEYEILTKLHERTSQHVDRYNPFPVANSFLALADGGMLTMETSSATGMTLADLCRLYTTSWDQSMPEALVFHYTARMLRYLEILHWHGKILHCDTKPDNWILTKDGTDLMLVDFGRAIDLRSVENTTNRKNVMDTVFCGRIAVDEMMCVSMRQDRPWSFDLDTFGVCFAAHMLLCGCHLEIEKKPNHRWMPKQSLARHTGRDLWTEIFDTLLNVDRDFGIAMGSRPYSLKKLRGKIEARLRDESTQLESAFKIQDSLMLRESKST